jgi:hypothetical protein
VSGERSKRSAYLGQFPDEMANAIAGELEAAEILWSYKQAIWITKVLFLGEWGTRLFVEADRIDEARQIVERVRAMEGSDG